MIDWRVCLGKAIFGIAAIMLGLMVGCALRLCHPDDGSCYASDRSINRMSTPDLIRELSK